jgi:hypothetical protein
MARRKIRVPGIAMPPSSDSNPDSQHTRARLALSTLSPEQLDLAAAAAAETANGGSFFDSRFYTEEQRDRWRRIARAAIDAAIGTPTAFSTEMKNPPA